MTISIVIPTYNGEIYIEQALKSVLEQTRPADEIIISDDNSTDCTLEICSKYADRIKIYKNNNGPSGFVNGWNNAIAHATSDFVSILHQDDLLDPTFIEEAEHAFTLYKNARHLFVPCRYIDENSNVKRSPDYTDGSIRLLKGSEYVHMYRTLGSPHVHRCPGVITKKDLFEVCKYREEAGHIADDDFFYRVGQYTEIIGIFKTLASYREHNASETGHLSDPKLLKRLIKDLDFQLSQFGLNSVFNNRVKQDFHNDKNKFIIRLIGYALKNKDVENLSYAFHHMDRSIFLYLLNRLFNL